MSEIASQITSLTTVYSIVYSDADQRKHQSSASLAFVRGLHRGPVNSPHKWPVTRKMFPFDDVIIIPVSIVQWRHVATWIWQSSDQVITPPKALGDRMLFFNTLRPRQNGGLSADDTFKGIFVNENKRISIKISLKFVPKGPFNNIPALVLIMAWRRLDHWRIYASLGLNEFRSITSKITRLIKLDPFY